MTSRCSYSLSSIERSFLYRQKIADGESITEAWKEIKDDKKYLKKLKDIKWKKMI